MPNADVRYEASRPPHPALSPAARSIQLRKSLAGEREPSVEHVTNFPPRILTHSRLAAHQKRRLESKRSSWETAWPTGNSRSNKLALFEETIELACNPQALFDFMCKPLNVAKISDPRLGLSFVKAPDIVEMGSRLTFKVQKHGMIQNATHEIIQYDRPILIVELQVEGPLKAWRHEHHFEATPTGARMRDRIEFEPPSGILGMLYGEDKILDSLEESFFYRQGALQKFLSRGELA